MCLNFGTLKIINFPYGTNGKLIILGVSILTHIMFIPICLTVLSNDPYCAEVLTEKSVVTNTNNGNSY